MRNLNEKNNEMNVNAENKQMSYIRHLAEERNLDVEMSKCLNSKTRNLYIKELLAIPRVVPASEKQIKLIIDNCELLGIKAPDVSNLTGGYGGTASKFIELTNKKISELNKERLASEKQVTTILNMRNAYVVTDVLTDEEIASLSSVEASQYINKWIGAYTEWKRTRLNAGQMQKIKYLTEKMGCVFDEVGIMQLDEKTADLYIEQLQYELQQKVWSETTLEVEDLRNNVEVDEVQLVHQLYASIGMEADVETVNNIDINNLKDLIQLVEMYGINTYSMLMSCYKDENIVNILRSDLSVNDITKQDNIECSDIKTYCEIVSDMLA